MSKLGHLLRGEVNGVQFQHSEQLRGLLDRSNHNFTSDSVNMTKLYRLRVKPSQVRFE
jgi:hypothetical protein